MTTTERTTNKLELMIEDLNAKFNGLSSLHVRSCERLFITGCFETVRNEIDYKAERLFFELDQERENNPGSEKPPLPHAGPPQSSGGSAVIDEAAYANEIDALNQIRQWMLDELDRYEAKLLEELENKISPQPDAYLKEAIDIFMTDAQEAAAGDPNVMTRLQNNYETIIVDIEKRTEKRKSELLNNHAFVFCDTMVNGFGILLIFEDKYLTEYEARFLK